MTKYAVLLLAILLVGCHKDAPFSANTVGGSRTAARNGYRLDTDCAGVLTDKKTRRLLIPVYWYSDEYGGQKGTCQPKDMRKRLQSCGCWDFTKYPMTSLVTTDDSLGNYEITSDGPVETTMKDRRIGAGESVTFGVPFRIQRRKK